jgi:hypothetical protein
MGAKVQDAPDKRKDGASRSVLGAAMSNAFAANAVLLVGEGQIHRRGRGNIAESTRGGGNCPWPVVEGDIAEAKRRTVGVGCARVFARPAQEEKANERHVTHSA